MAQDDDLEVLDTDRTHSKASQTGDQTLEDEIQEASRSQPFALVSHHDTIFGTHRSP